MRSRTWSGAGLAVLDHLRQAHAIHVFHDQHGGLRTVQAGPEEVHELGHSAVPQPDQHAGLPLEQLVRLEVGHGATVQGLDGDHAVALEVARQIRVPEPAAAERPDDLVPRAHAQAGRQGPGQGAAGSRLGFAGLGHGFR
jgi:hypothetical protein